MPLNEIAQHFGIPIMVFVLGIFIFWVDRNRDKQTWHPPLIRRDDK